MSLAFSIADGKTNQESTSKPEASTDEGKGLRSLPLVADTAFREAAPVESTAAADTLDLVDEQAESGEESSGHEEVEGVVEQRAREWDHPDKREEKRNDRDD